MVSACFAARLPAIEKLIGEKNFYKKTPRFIKWFFTMAVTFVCWGAIFRSSPIDSITWFKRLFGLDTPPYFAYTWQHFFDKQILSLAIIGFLGSTAFGWSKVQALYHKLLNTKVGYLIHAVVVTALFIIAIMFMVNSQYSPFIYFQY